MVGMRIWCGMKTEVRLSFGESRRQILLLIHNTTARGFWHWLPEVCVSIFTEWLKRRGWGLETQTSINFPRDYCRQRWGFLNENAEAFVWKQICVSLFPLVGMGSESAKQHPAKPEHSTGTIAVWMKSHTRWNDKNRLEFYDFWVPLDPTESVHGISKFCGLRLLLLDISFWWGYTICLRERITIFELRIESGPSMR